MRLGRSVLAFCTTIALTFETMGAPCLQAASAWQPDASAEESADLEGTASYINKLEDVNVDYTDYLDSQKVFRLPDGVGDDQEISVIVTLDTEDLMDAYDSSDAQSEFSEFVYESDEAQSVREEISDRKEQILSALDEQDIEYTLGEDYSTILSGFELRIKAGDFEATCMSLGDGADVIVGEEYETAETELVENEVNAYETGIFDSSDSGYDGSGMVVAVLDTGIDSSHTAFSVDNFTSDKLGLTYDDVAALIDDTTASTWYEGLSADDVYINEKIPFGFDYADNDPDVYSTHNSHGTHVSGVIAGKDDTITGVAPNAQIVSMKIFSDVEDTARTASILAALEDCVVLGVDVINMSLGQACGFSRESDEEALNGVYSRIRESGISMVVAASNSYSSAYGSEANGNLGLTSNPDTATVGSPSTYEGVMSVASISGVETPYLLYEGQIIYFLESTDSVSEENDFVETLLGDEDSIEIEYVVVNGVGRSADYTGLDVEGKIALVRRGSNTFEEKALIAEENGAAGIIIYNNVSGDIKMNVGDAKLAVCSISQDDGEMMAEAGSGVITIKKSQTSGPFISDFSSWGPTPDLGIKPEITAHGGSILSAVTGGSYERLSGTSMACPNLAGVVVLLRQYVVENFPEIADDSNEVTAMVYKLLMSTADIAFGKDGDPYAVRKQGAGLADLLDAIGTTAYITTLDSDGNEMDKTKLELGDDKEKTGVYEMSFIINNFGDTSLSYDVGAYVMTETVSDTKTAAGKTTVKEESYILDGAQITIDSVEGGELDGYNVTVAAGGNAKVTVTIELSDDDKKYLDDSFENGMYVEGFLTLTATDGTLIDLNVPYLAFYGDWTEAPLFDRDYYETNEDELNDALDAEDKTMADAYATRPVGGISDDYVSYLGTYYFSRDPDDIAIPADMDHISLSNQQDTVHSLSYVWAGLLRNAAKVEISIEDKVTGEVIYETENNDVRKSYGDGGTSIYPANIKVLFDTYDYNLKNNSEYIVKLQGYLDYDDGGVETNEKNTFEFPLYIDFEAPTVEDVEFYYEYDDSLEKNRLYAKVAIYDNHYSMASMLGYIQETEDEDGNTSIDVIPFEQYLTPVYSEKNSTTYVTYELTDYIYDMKDALTSNSFVVICYDYALNYATYEIGLPTDFTDFYLDTIDDEIVISPNEVYTLTPAVYPSEAWAELLNYSSSKTSVARVVNNKVVGVKKGNAIIKIQDPVTNNSKTVRVTVLGENDDGYKAYDKPVADRFSLDGYYTSKAYYMINNEDMEIGDTGSTNFFEERYSLSMYPSESVILDYTLDAYFPNDTTVEFESSNDSIVRVNELGAVTAVAEGYASVTINVLLDGNSGYYSKTVSVEVKDPYVTTGPSLTHYYGNGGIVSIPAELSITEIGNFAFSNFEYIAKTEDELALDDTETTKMWYIGEDTITKVIIPEGVKSIGAYAFANLTSLEEIVLPSTLEQIDYGAFYGCSSLETISFSGDNNLKIINQHAFEGCNITGELELASICVISDYAFAANKNLKGVILADSLISIGRYAFASCQKLSNVDISAEYVKYGAYAFTDCESLTEFYVNSAVIPEGMFYQAEAMTKVTVGPDVNDIGEFAFRETGIAEFEISAGNKAYKVQTADYIISADGERLVAVSPVVTGTYTSENIGGTEVAEIADGAFSHNKSISEIVLGSVTAVGDYAFASNKRLTGVSLGNLTDIGEYAFYETGIRQTPALSADMNIGKYAFSDTDITVAEIPDGMTLEEGVFSECQKLQTITIGNNVTIGAYAFSLNKDNNFELLNYDEDGKRYFYYKFVSPVSSLTIGDNAVIGESAFANMASVESVTLGDNAQIGNMAFYNCSELKEIDLSKASSIGDYALSGDVFYICLDDAMSVAAVSSEGSYVYSYHAPLITSADLSSAESIGAYAFTYCRELSEVKLGEAITSIPEYAFAGCIKLDDINLGQAADIGGYAFMECGLSAADLSSAETIGDYAFVSNTGLSQVVLSEKKTSIGEGAFSYCGALTDVENLQFAEDIGDYCFAYAGLTQADLSGAVSIGDMAFLKEEITPFSVVLGKNIDTIGDNPFALCDIEAFSVSSTETFGDNEYTEKVYDYDISDSVKVVDGSLYCKVRTGWELITFAGVNEDDVSVADDTVRITSMAFAYSGVVTVRLPYTVASIGHKAFYGCDDLNIVIFTSYNAPILEEEFDPTYFESLEHIPGSGDYGTYTDYDGNEVTIEPMELIQYYMWNVTGMYSNIFYGANFVDYVGYVDDKLVMIRPVNGLGYETYIMGQYFGTVIDGAAAADEYTLAAIAAINALPEKVMYSDKELVEAARAAYDRIATIEQQALVTNYPQLVSAEQRIKALAPSDGAGDAGSLENDGNGTFGVGLAVVLIVILAIAGFVVYTKKFRPDNRAAVLLRRLWGGFRDKYDVLSQKVGVCVSRLQAKNRVRKAEENRQLREAASRKAVTPMDKPEVMSAMDAGGGSAAAGGVGWKVRTGVAAAVVVCAVALFMIFGGSSEKTQYQINDEDNYVVSAVYDANGGTFTANTSVITDSFKIDDMAADSDGNVSIALIAPDNSARGNDAFKPVRSGYILAGWYSERTASTDSDGNTTYVYSDKWDFDNDLLTIDKNQSYQSEDPVITLYAAWVPMFEIQIYDLGTQEYIDSIYIDPQDTDTVEVPRWDEDEGIMQMYDFPERSGYTFEKAYYDADGREAVDTDVIEHTGYIDEKTGTAVDSVMKLYVEWTEGEWYHIYTAEQFVDNANVNGCYEIYADLDFTDETWPSSFMYGNFGGTINGNGHTFQNITFAQTDNSKTYAGMFGNITETAKISDITFENVIFTIEAGVRVEGARFGLFAGAIADEAQLSGIHISDSILQIDSASYFGAEDYLIGLVCAVGEADIEADISCEASGDDPQNVDINVDESGMVTVEIITE